VRCPGALPEGSLRGAGSGGEPATRRGAPRPAAGSHPHEWGPFSVLRGRAPGRQGGRAGSAASEAVGRFHPDRACCSRRAGARERVSAASPGRTVAGSSGAAAVHARHGRRLRCAPRHIRHVRGSRGTLRIPGTKAGAFAASTLAQGRRRPDGLRFHLSSPSRTTSFRFTAARRSQAAPAAAALRGTSAA